MMRRNWFDWLLMVAVVATGLLTAGACFGTTLVITLTPEDGRQVGEYAINGNVYTEPAIVDSEVGMTLVTAGRYQTVHDFSWFFGDVVYPLELIVVNGSQGRFTYQYEDVYFPVRLPVVNVPEPSDVAMGFAIGLALLAVWVRKR